MSAVVFACGASPPPYWDPYWRAVPPIPGKADVDRALGQSTDRVVVIGTDAALAAVVLRLLRTDRLGVPVGFVPVDRRSAVARLWGLPAHRQLELALGGEARRLPLIRDDSGGVLLGRGAIGPVRGEAYCDDQLALRGRARLIEVSPDPDGALLGRVHSGLLRRAREYRGRAFQVGCHPTSVVCDGVRHPRPVRRWTWYRHTEDLRAVCLPG